MHNYFPTSNFLFSLSLLVCFICVYLHKVGNHIDISSGLWTAVDSGIGAGVDSYYEYLVKGGILLGKRKLLETFRGIFIKITQLCFKIHFFHYFHIIL